MKTVAGLGDELARFDQADLPDEKAAGVFPADAVGFDLGWGTGLLHCIDPSSAIDIARKNLATTSVSASPADRTA